jgi:hypothetical protein
MNGGLGSRFVRELLATFRAAWANNIRQQNRLQPMHGFDDIGLLPARGKPYHCGWLSCDLVGV